MDFGFPFVVPFRITKQWGVPSLQKRPAQFDPPTSLDILAGAMALAHACKLALLGQEGGRKVAGRNTVSGSLFGNAKKMSHTCLFWGDSKVSATALGFDSFPIHGSFQKPDLFPGVLMVS